MAKQPKTNWQEMSAYVPQVSPLKYNMRDAAGVAFATLFGPMMVYAAPHLSGANLGQTLCMYTFGATLPLWAMAMPIKEGRVLTPQQARRRNRQLVAQHCNV